MYKDLSRTGINDARPIESEVGNEEENLPDRLVNPDGYRLLSEEDDTEINHPYSIPTYGSTHFTCISPLIFTLCVEIQVVY